MVEPEDHILEMLKRMRRENGARFNAMSRDMSAIHQRLDLIVASYHDIAAAQASHDARIEMLEPDEE